MGIEDSLQLTLNNREKEITTVRAFAQVISMHLGSDTPYSEQTHDLRAEVQAITKAGILCNSCSYDLVIVPSEKYFRERQQELAEQDSTFQTYPITRGHKLKDIRVEGARGMLFGIAQEKAHFLCIEVDDTQYFNSASKAQLSEFTKYTANSIPWKWWDLWMDAGHIRKAKDSYLAYVERLDPTGYKVWSVEELTIPNEFI